MVHCLVDTFVGLMVVVSISYHESFECNMNLTLKLLLLVSIPFVLERIQF